jgi:NitT/TauT family transport system substrate-binding protein
MRKILLFALLCVVFITMQAQKIVFTPQWLPQAQFAGYYVAYDKGFYREAGLYVEIKHPSSSYSAFHRLLDGSSNMITQQLVQAMIAMDHGIPMVHVLQTSQQNALLLVNRTDEELTLEGLKDKRVGVWKVGFGDVFRIMCAEKGINTQWVPYLDGVNLFVSGAVDALLTMSYNEYQQVKVAGFEDKPFIRLCDTEYNFPEDGLYTTPEFKKKYPEDVRDFAEASRRGWEYAREHPEEALDIVMKWMEKENVYTSRIHQQWMLEEVLRLQCGKEEEKPSFVLEPEKLERLSDLLLKYGRIYAPVTWEKMKGGKP